MTVKAFAAEGASVTRHSLPGLPDLALTLRRSARARRISLRVSALDGRVILTLPAGVPEAEALAFARSRADWIRRALDSRPDGAEIGIGATLPVEGAPRRIVAAAGRRVDLRADEIAVPADAAGPRLRAWLTDLARDRLTLAADHYAAALGCCYSRLSLRDTRSRWGSCSAGGALSFSWRLVLAPPPVLRYVAAHEAAHLAEMNHSPAFWTQVERIHGPFDAPRLWLRTHGAGLHRYRF